MRGRRGLVLIQRPRLLELLSASQTVLLEAPGGYGKSTVCAQFAAAMDMTAIRVVLRGGMDLSGLLSSIVQGCRRAGLAALAGAIDPDDPQRTSDRLADQLAALNRSVILAVDEVHRADRVATEWLANLSRELPDGHRMVVAGRRLGPALARLADGPDATILDVDTLRFDREEVCVLLGSMRPGRPELGEVEELLAATDGWPAAVVLAAARPVGADGLGAVMPHAAAGSLRRLVDGLLDGSPPETRELVAATADLPLLSTEVMAAVGGAGSLDRLLEAGMPIRFRADGWGELPDPLRELFPSGALPIPQARRVSQLYAENGELAEAAGLLRRMGDHEGLVALLARQRRDALASAGLPYVDALLADVPESKLGEHPRLLVQLVQAAERQPRLRTAWLDRARHLLEEGTVWRRAIDAEAALDSARAGDLEGAVETADRILAAAGGDEAVTRGRAHLCRALCLLMRDTAGSTGEVATELELAIGLFTLAGERGWEAEAHQALGYGVYFTTGAYERAAERLDRALALRSAPDGARAGTLTFLGEVLTHLCRFDDAAVALREATAIGHRLADSRAIAYAAWSAAELACQRRDRESAVAALEEAERHPDGWFDNLAGIDFLSHAAEIRAILRDEAGAWRDLHRAEERAAKTARQGEPLSARVRLEATVGDPSAALAHLDELDKSQLAYRSDRWLHLLFRAVANARLGEREGAAALVERSRQAAADLGDAQLPERREPELLALAALPEDRPPAAPTPTETTVILLGRFAVERGGVDATPPPGRPSTLVKLVSLQGTITVDETIDALWPDADLDTGRARLRNLLNRVQQSSGALLSRRDGALSLAPGIVVDAHRFEEEAAAALAARREERVGLCRGALVRSTGELLPADRYADWATVPRERLRRRHLALLDLVAEDAIERGDLDEADRLLDTAITTDPMEELRYVRLARALLAQGRTRQARRVAQQGMSVAAELDVQPGEELAALVTELALAEGMNLFASRG